jgi:hypothetical protein
MFYTWVIGMDIRNGGSLTSPTSPILLKSKFKIESNASYIHSRNLFLKKYSSVLITLRV